MPSFFPHLQSRPSIQMARMPLLSLMSSTQTNNSGIGIMGLDQSLREAFMDARLANEWYTHGEAWARMDLHGIELSREPEQAFEERCVMGSRDSVSHN